MPIVEGVATGVASSLILESLRRPIEALTAEIKRRDKVGRALTDRPSARSVKEAANLDRIAANLARVIGSGQGHLTTSVSEFLRELRRTAIPEAVANAALCGSNPESLREPFRLFYERFASLPFTADQLFNALYEACRERVEDVQDAALLEILRAQHSELTSRVELIALSLQAALSEKKSYPVATLREARLKVARAVEADNRYVSVETLQGAKKFKLKSLAIPGRLANLDVQDIETAKMPPQAPTIGFLPFRRQFNRAVILGDPGGGKSTLTQMLSADQASIIQLEFAHPDRRDFEQRDLKIPLKVVLRRFEARLARNPAYTFFDHLKDELRPSLEGDGDLARAFLSSVLGTGEAIVLFDGLDEVLDVGARREMVEKIEQFSQIYVACPILVTSRLVGYRDAPLSGEFSMFGLARFNDEEILKYAQKAIAAVGQVKMSEAKLKAAEFMNQSARVASDLRENPLMLGLMVQIYVYRGDVPANRPEVYRECATLMFEKWDGRREISADVPRYDVELLDVFGYVASRTFGDARSEEGVSREWLVRELRSHFEGWYVDRASANRAANSLVDFLTGRAWVMSEVGQGTYKFTHRTFLEYFFARNLISESRGIDELIEVDLIPHVIGNQWSVISHLALHMAVFRDGGKSRQAAQTITRMLDDLILPAQQELAFLRFVSSTLGYLVIPESAYVRIVKRTVARAVELGAHEDVSALSVIEQICATAQLREKLALAEITAQFERLIDGPDRSELLFAMYAMGGSRRSIRGAGRPRGVYIAASGLSGRLLSIREKRKERLRGIALSDSSVARAYILVYGEDRARLYRAHGSELLMSTASRLMPPVLDMILFDSIDVLIADGHEDVATEVLDDCREFVEVVTDDVLAGRIELDRLLLPARLRDSSHERYVEVAFRDLWQLARIRRTDRSLGATHSACLVCILASSAVEGDAGRPKVRRAAGLYHQYLPAPPDIVGEMIERVDDVKLRAWLDMWFAHAMRPH